MTIESTTRIVEVSPRRGAPPIQCRVWEGKTESGIAVQCLIPRIATPEEGNRAEFEKELRQCRAPEIIPQAFLSRLRI